MRSRAPLALMELLVMVLVFALAAALCLNAFVLSRTMTQRNQQQDEAALLAQNAAETLKLTRGNLTKAAQRLGGQVSGSRWTLEQQGLRLEVERLSADIPGLGQARVQVLAGEEPLITLQAAWQEVGA